MQNTASLSTDEFLALLARLPGISTLIGWQSSTRRFNAVARSRPAPGCCAWPWPTGQAACHCATPRVGPAPGLATLSNPAVKYRLDNAVDFLKAITDHLLTAKSASQALHWPGRTLRASDGSCISKPGSKGADWRVHGVYDLGAGGFSNLELTDGKGAETLTYGAPVAGEVRIADRGYCRSQAWHKFLLDSGGKADLIVRLKWNAFHLTGNDGAPFNLIDHLTALPDNQVPHEIGVQALVCQGVTMPIRLIVLRKSPEAAEATRKTLRTQASRKQKTLNPRSLVAAEFMIIGTSLPVKGYPAGEILAAYRLRWQIELAFKRLKSLLRIDKLPAHTNLGARSGSIRISSLPCYVTI